MDLRNAVRSLASLIVGGLVLVSGLTRWAGAQQATPAPTPAEVTDPYEAWARDYYKVQRIPKKFGRVVSPGILELVGPVHGTLELLGEEGDNYLARNLPVEDPRSPAHEAWLFAQFQESERLNLETKLKSAFFVVDEPDSSLVFTDRLAMEDASKGLPSEGRWQMSFDVADFNGDGKLDLVLPPPRGGDGRPIIFIQGGTLGDWQPCGSCRWPREGVKLDYGAVRVADFDGDGHLDVLLASHFADTVVMYGDGKGDFTRYVKLPKPNQAFSARAAAIADVDRDGRPDVVTLAELDVDIGTGQRVTGPIVSVVFNKKDGWVLGPSDGIPTEGHGDWLAVADLDTDGFPDLLITSRKEGITSLVLRNVGGGQRWQPIAEEAMPFGSYVFSVAAGVLDDKKGRDVVYCFEQFHPLKKVEPSQACGLYRFYDAKGQFAVPKKGELLWKMTGYFENPVGVAMGDLDGDGRNDLVVIFAKRPPLVLLRGLDGRWLEERSPELEAAFGKFRAVDVRIADLDKDGHPELLFMGPPKDPKEGGGGVFVFRVKPRKALR